MIGTPRGGVFLAIGVYVEWRACHRLQRRGLRVWCFDAGRTRGGRPQWAWAMSEV